MIQQHIATNEAVLKALGIAELGRNATRVELLMEPGALPMLTVQMLVDETPPECHLPPLGGFDLDMACREAVVRLLQHIHLVAFKHKVYIGAAFRVAIHQSEQRHQAHLNGRAKAPADPEQPREYRG